MGYSTSAKTVEKLLPQLRKLEAGQPCTWIIESGITPHKFCYKIREALYAARCNAARFPRLSQAYDRFIISVVNDRTVQASLRAVPRDRTAVVVVQGDEPVPEIYPGQTLSGPSGDIHIKEVIASVPETKTVDGPQTRFSVISLWDGLKPATIHMPEAALSEQDLARLYNWAKAQQPPLMLMCNPPEPFLTLGLVDPEVVEFEWRPTA